MGTGAPAVGTGAPAVGREHRLWAREHRLWARGDSSCGPTARGMWNPPGPGIESVSPALQANVDHQGSPLQSFSKSLFLEIFSRREESILTPITEL